MFGQGGRLLLAETEPDRSKGAGKAPETRNDSAVGARVPLGLALFSKTQALDVYFELAPGLVLLFPSYMQHFVHPFSGKGRAPRVSISFNAV